MNDLTELGSEYMEPDDCDVITRYIYNISLSIYFFLIYTKLSKMTSHETVDPVGPLFPSYLQAKCLWEESRKFKSS